MSQSLYPSITALAARRHLSEAEAQAVIELLMQGEAADEEITVLLTAWRAKGVTVDELVGAARAMRALATPLRAPAGPLVDTCGTGGDNLDTFNVSTAAALIVAGAGVRVAKHGNRGVTSACGSADVLTALGVKVDVEPAVVSRCLEEAGIGFLYAPRFHPAMKHVAAAREQLGVRTIFNLLGPLTNPAGVIHQIVGVSDPEIMALIATALQRLGSQRAMVVHGEDGVDEVSTTAPTRVVELARGRIVTYTVTPEAFGFSRARLDQLRGGDPARCAQIIRSVLEGQPGPCRDAALLNAACALYIAGAAVDITLGVAMARQSADSGQALARLQQLVTLTNV